MDNLTAVAYWSELDCTWRGVLQDENRVTQHMCRCARHYDKASAERCAERYHADMKGMQSGTQVQ